MRKAEHFANVGALGCIITGNFPIVLHHCGGGSMKERGWHVGMAQRQNHGLVLPLLPCLHNGGVGIHTIGVRTWEASYGTQAEHLDRISELLGYDVWELAKEWQPDTRILPRR